MDHQFSVTTKQWSSLDLDKITGNTTGPTVLRKNTKEIFLRGLFIARNSPAEEGRLSWLLNYLGSICIWELVKGAVGSSTAVVSWRLER